MIISMSLNGIFYFLKRHRMLLNIKNWNQTICHHHQNHQGLNTSLLWWTFLEFQWANRLLLKYIYIEYHIVCNILVRVLWISSSYDCPILSAVILDDSATSVLNSTLPLVFCVTYNNASTLNTVRKTSLKIFLISALIGLSWYFILSFISFIVTSSLLSISDTISFKFAILSILLSCSSNFEISPSSLARLIW